MSEKVEIAVGIDIGGTNTKIGIVSRQGIVLHKSEIKTTDYVTADIFINALSLEIKNLLARYESATTIMGIGIGAPNGNYFKGTIEHAPNLRWKGVIPLAEMLHEKFDCAAFLTNDANAAALGEKIYGGAKDMNDFILVTLGTGLGSGFFVNGGLVYGHDGFAGELGHTIYEQNGRLCGCGRRGCLEQYVSATGIVLTAHEKLKNSTDKSLLRDIEFEKISAKYISDAAIKGDKLALEIFDYTAKILGFKLADTIAITSPEAIFLLGGLANAGDLLFVPTKKYMEEYLLNIFSNKVNLLPSQLPGSDAAILGASALVWNHI